MLPESGNVTVELVCKLSAEGGISRGGLYCSFIEKLSRS